MTDSARPDTDRLASVELDAATLPAATAEIEHERRVAIFDLVEKNAFRPEGATGGPYALKLSLQDSRLVFDISGPDYARAHGLSLTPLKTVLRDYLMICDSYYEALRGSSPSQIETCLVPSFLSTTCRLTLSTMKWSGDTSPATTDSPKPQLASKTASS